MSDIRAALKENNIDILRKFIGLINEQVNDSNSKMRRFRDMLGQDKAELNELDPGYNSDDDMYFETASS